MSFALGLLSDSYRPNSAVQRQQNWGDSVRLFNPIIFTDTVALALYPGPLGCA